VLVEVSASEAKVIGLANMRSLVDNYRAEYGVEMYVNLDHSPSVEAAKAGIDAGFEFVHIDYSQANRDAIEADIVAATRSRRSSTSNCCGASVTPSTATSASTAAAERIDLFGSAGHARPQATGGVRRCLIGYLPRAPFAVGAGGPSTALAKSSHES
jgi:hypothetical protein